MARPNETSALFDRSAMALPGDRHVSAYRIVCGSCGGQDKASNNRASNGLPDDAIAAIFRNRGWTVGSRRSKHVCPKCAERARQPRQVIKHEDTNVVELKPFAEPPREMSREDRRVIFAKINDVYLDEASGYSAGWTDFKIAKDLGVPSAWVKQIREENFGADGGNDEMRELIAEGQKVLDGIEKASKQFAEQRDVAFARIAEMHAAFAKKLADLKKQFGVI